MVETGSRLLKSKTKKIKKMSHIALQPPKLYTARLTEKYEYNAKYHQFHFELYGEQNSLSFKSGQYVSIQVSERGDRRPYSISSSPEITHGFDILLDVSPQGVGSTFLSNLKFGDSIKILAPMGRFTLDPATDTHSKPAVFIATGSGIAPFKSMLHELLQIKQARLVQDPDQQRFAPREITLHWGMRYAQDLFWLEEMEEFMDNFSNFHFNPMLSQPTPEWNLSRGHVTDVLKISTLPDDADFYICGSQAMIESVREILQGRGVSEARVHYEKFY